MKKILLIDNYKDRLNQFRNNYPDLLDLLYGLEKEEEKRKTQLKNCALLLLHKNYFEDGLLVTDYIIEEIKNYGLDYLIFSGEESRDSEIIQVNSMYKNLSSFVKHYRETGKVVKKILRYGKLYPLEESLKIRLDIFKGLFEEKLDQPLKLEYNLKEKFKNLFCLLDYSEENINQSLEVDYTIGSFKNKIDDLILELQKK